jgi:hypothetical protein
MWHNSPPVCWWWLLPRQAWRSNWDRIDQAAGRRPQVRRLRRRRAPPPRPASSSSESLRHGCHGTVGQRRARRGRAGNPQPRHWHRDCRWGRDAWARAGPLIMRAPNNTMICQWQDVPGPAWRRSVLRHEHRPRARASVTRAARFYTQCV